MNDSQKTKTQLIDELKSLRKKVAKLENVSFNNILPDGKLKESESILNAILQSVNEGIIYTDLKGKVLYVNNSLSKITNIPKNEILGKNSVSLAKKFISVKQLPSLLKKITRAFAGKKIGPYELEFQNKILEISTNFDRRSKRIGGIIRDITDRKLAEKAIKESEKLLRNVLDASPYSIYVKDLEGRYILVNKKMADSHKTTPQALVGKADISIAKEWLKTPQQIQDFRNQEKNIIKNKKNKFIKEEKFTFSDGRERWFQTIKIPISVKDNPDCLLGVSLDITDRVNAEQNLRDSEQRLKLALQGADLGLWDWNVQTGQVIFNHRWAEMLGYTLDEIEPNVKTWQKLVHPDDMPDVSRTLEAHLKGETNGYETEHRVLTKDGNWKWILDRGKVLEVDNDGEPIRAVGTHLDITERKQAGEAIKASKKMLDDVLNTIPVRVFWKDLDGNYLGCNQLFAKDAGKKKPDDLIGDNDYNMGWAEQAELYRSDDKLVIKNDTPKINYEEPQTTPSGETIWLRTSKFPLRNNDGTVYGILGTYEDITRSKKTELALQESEARFRYTVESSPMGMHFYKLHKNGQLIFTGANPAADRILNVDNSVFIGRSIDEAFPALKDTEVPSKYKQIAIDGGIWKTEQIEYKDKEIEGAFEIVAFQTEPNKMVSMFNEITEKKKAQEALKESEQKFRTLIEQSNDAIYLLHNDKFEVINSKFSDMFGYTLKECQANDFNFRQLIAPQSIPLVENRIAKRSEGKEIESVYEFTAISKDGREIECEVCTSHIEYKAGLAVQGILRDITERKRSEEEKAKLEEQLRRAQKMETIGTLAGGIAHDFNNILAPIMGYTDMALLSLSKTDPLYSDLQHVLKGAQRAKELVEQILLFSKQSEKERKPQSLQSLVKEALKLLRPSIPATIEINQFIDNTCSKIQADATQMHQVIVNLCTNAWQAMEDEGGSLTIELIELELDKTFAKLYPNLNKDKYVRLSISDTGPGMDEKTLERIFEPFFTTKAVNKGTGLGLSVVHGIVSSHKGDIQVISKPGKGSVFHVYLPTIKSEETIPSKKSKEIAKGSEYVLIVDDETAIGDLIKKVLENFGYKTEVYNSGLDAFEAFKKNHEKFDLLITDLTMPQMTGFDLADEMHKIKKEFPVIIMTGFGDSITKSTQERYGVKQVLVKPVAIEQLTSAVRIALDK